MTRPSPVLRVQHGSREGTFLHLAPWGKRAAASTIDTVPGTALVLAAVVNVARATTTSEVRRPSTEVEGWWTVETVTSTPGQAWTLLAVAAGVALALWVLNAGVLQGRHGWTVGKRLVGVRLVDVRTGGPVGVLPALDAEVGHDWWTWRHGIFTADDEVEVTVGDTAVVLATAPGRPWD